MLRISDQNKLTDYITDQGFTRVTAKTMDDTQVLNVVHNNAKELAEGLNDWLNRFNGTYILNFRVKENSPVFFGVKWEPDQTASGALLNGTPGDYDSIRRQIIADIKAEQAREAEREELNRLKTINGQLGAVLETVLPGLIQAAAKYFGGPAMAAPAANLQGINLDELPEKEQEITELAVSRLLRQVSPQFLLSLANYTEQHPDIVPVVAQMIGHNETNPEPQKQDDE